MNPIQRLHARQLAWALLAASAAARADLVPVQAVDEGPAALVRQAQTIFRTGPCCATASGVATAQALAAAATASEVPVRSLSSLEVAPASLWVFVTRLRAQQGADTFALLRGNLEVIQRADSVAQVPLPAAGWLLAAALLGIAGACVRPSARVGAAAQARL